MFSIFPQTDLKIYEILNLWNYVRRYDLVPNNFYFIGACPLRVWWEIELFLHYLSCTQNIVREFFSGNSFYFPEKMEKVKKSRSQSFEFLPINTTEWRRKFFTKTYVMNWIHRRFSNSKVFNTGLDCLASKYLL